MRRNAIAFAVLLLLASSCGSAEEPTSAVIGDPVVEEAPGNAEGKSSGRRPADPAEVVQSYSAAGEDDTNEGAPPAETSEQPSVPDEPLEEDAAPDTPAPTSVPFEEPRTMNPPPAFMAEFGAEAYFSELIAWLMAEDLTELVETSESEPSEAEVQALLDLQMCVADTFLEMFDSERLQEMALDLADVENLWDGLPQNLLTPEEMELLVATAHPCVGSGIVLLLGTTLDEALGGDAPLTAAGMPADAEAEARLRAGFEQCGTAMAGSEDVTRAMLHSAIFDVSEEDAEMREIQIVLELCGESLMVPMMAEIMIAEMGADPLVAACVAPLLITMIRDMVSAGVSVEDGPTEHEALLSGVVFLGAMLDCGLTMEDLFEMDFGALDG